MGEDTRDEAVVDGAAASNATHTVRSWSSVRSLWPLLIAAAIVLAGALALPVVAPKKNARPRSERSFSAALAASEMLDGFSSRGSYVSSQLLELYRAELDPFFEEYERTELPAAAATGYTMVLQINDTYLNDPEIGILARSEKKGIDWERPGRIVLLRDGEEVLASRVGVRVHGGFARIAEDKSQISYRLYFRAAYRSLDLEASTIWPEAKGGLTTIVVLKTDMDLHTAVSFDVARRLGLPAPHMAPMRFFINDADQRTKLMSQHLGTPFLEETYGDGAYEYFRRKDDDSNPLFKEFQEIVGRLKAEKGQYTLDDVARYIDVDALFRAYLMHMFIELYDSYQGMVVRKRDGSDRRWFFVPWDLEGSMMYNSLAQQFYEVHPEETREYFVHLGSTRYLTRERIWTDLWADDAFRRRFARFAVDALNHLLTQDWLESEVDYYQQIGLGVGLEPRHIDEIEDIRGYITSRPEAILAFLSERWGLGAVYGLEIYGPEFTMRVDGYLTDGHYQGNYLEGMHVEVDLPVADAEIRWTVNGEPVEAAGRRLSILMDSEKRVQYAAK